MVDIRKVEAAIGYTFKNIKLLRTALTHTSYSNEHSDSSNNERLEFLGDSVLGFITAEELYNSRPNLSEGELTKLRAAYVCEESLCESARILGLHEALIVGKGETGSKRRASMTADAFEAVLSAVYLDGGMEFARAFVKKFLLSREPSKASADYKTALQEKAQRGGGSAPYYEVISETGPDHQKIFVVNALRDGMPIGRGQGKSKKAAEQAAAKDALEKESV